MKKREEYWECQSCYECYVTWSGALAHYDVNQAFDGKHDRFVLVSVFEDRGDPQSARE
jgi:hypothetical protein